ncbi:Fic family protein [Luteimonas sp. XNQY3]|nr:Fic family protein [Luteimonas sp. XNQY3]MCD9006768.1 Fic family protein [Luteimonas sp. XNQY3]
MGILMDALPRIPATRMRDEIHLTPGGAYIRLACHLWEQASGTLLDDLPVVTGRAVPLFAPERYVTGPATRNPRWRVDDNRLGTAEYCATVRRTPAIEAAIAGNLIAQANRYVAGLDGLLLDRTLAWAYLHETRDSFAIERETPSEERQRAYVALLHQAHARTPLSEDYLSGLQQATVTNPLDRAFGFRQQQNWLQGPLRGAAGVTYLPPPPELAHELMAALMTFANGPALAVDPLVAAGIVSFGFVLIHPFMDGNGRLSRFLFHHALCRPGGLRDGLILPVSVAMKKHEAEYLRALQTFSRPARERWNVEWAGEDTYGFIYRGDPGHAFYRYWDATACVEFGFRMAAQALQVELRQATEYLQRYDTIVRRIGERIDLRGSDLSTLVIACLEQGGRLSKRRRDQFGLRVPQAAFDMIETVTQEILANEGTHAEHDPAP